MTGTSLGHVVIAGVTTRPLAVSAARAGYRVTAIDAFGDRDLREAAEVILARLRPGQHCGPLQATAAAASVPADWAAYTSNFENYPAAVTRLAQGRKLLGNSAAALSRVRNPIAVMRVLRREGLVAPEALRRPPSVPSGSWLLKPQRSGGGHGITPWSPGQPVPRGMYLQQRISGLPGSISFAANGSSATVLGYTRQLVGQAELGGRRFRYCGSLLGTPEIFLFPRQQELLERAGEIASTLSREFQLVGLNGFDFIAHEGVPYPIEVNPRYSASMELIERAHGISMFEVHLQACQGVLPDALAPASTVYGKAIVFARRNIVVGEIPRRIQRQWTADIPHRGERISRGRPICTVFAEAFHPEDCRRLLGRRAATIYRIMRAQTRRAA